VDASDYALKLHSGLIRQLENEERDCTDLRKRLLIETRAWVEPGVPNKYAVMDRQKGAMHLLDEVGRGVPLPGGGTASIAPLPIEVRTGGEL
jgi:hypothetical protein